MRSDCATTAPQTGQCPGRRLAAQSAHQTWLDVGVRLGLGLGLPFFNTVNWLWIPLARRFAAAVKRGEWHNGRRTFHVRRFFSPSNPRVARFLASTWLLYIGAALDGADVLTRPAGAPPEKTRVIYGGDVA